MSGNACILGGHEFKPGDPPPDGYNAWHEWARVQDKAGLRQRQCNDCGLWFYPQECARPFLTGAVCLKCDAKADGPAKRRAP